MIWDYDLEINESENNNNVCVFGIKCNIIRISIDMIIFIIKHQQNTMLCPSKFQFKFVINQWYSRLSPNFT